MNVDLEWKDLDEVQCLVAEEEDVLTCAGKTESGKEVSFQIPIENFEMEV